MAHKNNILVVEDPTSFVRQLNRSLEPFDTETMVLPGTLDAKHENIGKGISTLPPEFNLVYLHLNGAHEMQMASHQDWLKPNDLVIIPENTIYASQIINNCTGYYLHFKTEFIQPLLNQEPLDAVFPYFDIEAEHVIHVTPEECKTIQHDFLDIISQNKLFSVEKNNLLRNYIHILLLHIKEVYRPHNQRLCDGSTQTMKLANHFKSLLGKNYLEIRTVAEYADKLHVSPKHLTDVVKRTFDKSPRQLINNILLREAKVLLQFTDLTVSEIAHRMSFHDHSHLNHFIRQHAGCSPLQLRKKF